MDLQRLNECIAAYDLDAYRPAILATARPAIFIRLDSLGSGDVGQSRIGGLPDLPPALVWPTSPSGLLARRFILQINLAELPALPGAPLPEHGMLYLFMGQGEHDPSQLIIYPGDERLVPRVAPTLPQVADDDGGLVAHRLVFTCAADIPRWWSHEYGELCEQVEPEDEDVIDDLAKALAAGSIGKLLGYAAGIGHDPRENAYLVRALGFTELYGPARATVDLAPARRWQNLLELWSSRAVNLTIGDAGYLQVLIHEDDLARHDLSQVYVNEESS